MSPLNAVGRVVALEALDGAGPAYVVVGTNAVAVAPTFGPEKVGLGEMSKGTVAPVIALASVEAGWGLAVGVPSPPAGERLKVKKVSTRSRMSKNHRVLVRVRLGRG